MLLLSGCSLLGLLTGGNYPWSATAGSGGAYVRDTSSGGPAAYIFDSFADTSVSDGQNAGAEIWFLSTSTNHAVQAVDSDFNADLAIPALTGTLTGTPATGQPVPVP